MLRMENPNRQMETAAYKINASFHRMAGKPKGSHSFFKILIQDFVKKLRIPPAFVKNFQGNVPTKFILKSNSGSSWQVRVQNKGGGYYFCGGWSNFVKDQGLESGDFIVFHWTDRATFDCVIYDPTCCEKKIVPAAKRRPGRPVKRPIEVKPCKTEASSSHKAGRVPRGRINTRATARRAVNIGHKIQVVSEEILEHPSFIVALKKYQTYFVAVPRSFAKAGGLAEKRNTVLKDPKGRMWAMSILVLKDKGQVRLSAGWSSFVRENKLVAGDTLLFQHIPGTGNAIHVQIVGKAGDGCEKKIVISGKRKRERPALKMLKEVTPSERGASSFQKARGVPRGHRIALATAGRAIKVEEQIEVLSDSEAISEHPSFVLVLKKCQRFNIYVPSTFAKEAGLADKRRTVIKDSKGRMWPISVLVGAKSQIWLSGGWASFLRENGLVVGDTLLFQYISGTGNAIHVQILRKAGDGRSGRWNKQENVF